MGILIIKWVLCLAILLAFYHLLLEKEKMHRFNRFYLLMSVVLSIAIPFITFEIAAVDSSNLQIPFVVTEAIEGEIATEPSSIHWERIFLITYAVIAAVLLIRFARNLYKLLDTAHSNPNKAYNGATVVLVDDNILPHSFWNYIFVNKEQFRNNEIEEELFTHELAHIRQKHTFDVLLLEVFQIFFWFNPLVIWTKKTVQLNHEFLADEHVISSYNNISRYQYLLLDKASWNNTYYLASNLNYSLTKKRLLKMKTQNSRFTEILKKVAVIPIIAGLVFVFSTKVEAQQTKKTPVVKEVSEKKSATREEMKEYNALLQQTEKSKLVKLKEVERMKYIYSKMSDKQKSSVKNYVDVLPPAPKVMETPPPPKPAKTKNPPPPKPVKTKTPPAPKKEDLPPPPPKPEKIEVVKPNKVKKSFGEEITGTISYYINDVKVTKKEVEQLDKTQIDQVKVTKDDDGNGTIEITTLK